MEAALNPPEKLERIVLALIPPCAREAVAGDLCETYENPRQYLREALRTVPFVVASQARRNLNLPVLLLQTALLWWLAGGFVTALALPLLVLREAWRPLARPDPVRAIRATMAVALLAMVFVQHLSFDNGVMRQMGLNYSAWISLYFFGFMVAPLLCALRTGVIVSGDRAPAPDALTLAALALDYRAFARRVRRRNWIEAGALALTAMIMAALSAQPILIALFALACVWLAMPGMAASAPRDADFASLRAHYIQELDRQQQQRRFLLLLWFAPVLVFLHDQALSHAHAMAAMMAAASLILLGFLVAALNRERIGRAQEDIGALERMREATAR